MGMKVRVRGPPAPAGWSLPGDARIEAECFLSVCARGGARKRVTVCCHTVYFHGVKKKKASQQERGVRVNWKIQEAGSQEADFSSCLSLQPALPIHAGCFLTPAGSWELAKLMVFSAEALVPPFWVDLLGRVDYPKTRK